MRRTRRVYAFEGSYAFAQLPAAFYSIVVFKFYSAVPILLSLTKFSRRKIPGGVVIGRWIRCGNHLPSAACPAGNWGEPGASAHRLS